MDASSRKQKKAFFVKDGVIDGVYDPYKVAIWLPKISKNHVG